MQTNKRLQLFAHAEEFLLVFLLRIKSKHEEENVTTVLLLGDSYVYFVKLQFNCSKNIYFMVLLCCFNFIFYFLYFYFYFFKRQVKSAGLLRIKCESSVLQFGLNIKIIMIFILMYNIKKMTFGTFAVLFLHCVN